MAPRQECNGSSQDLDLLTDLFYAIFFQHLFHSIIYIAQNLISKILIVVLNIFKLH